MTQQTINIGASANDATGDPIRTAFSKVNTNFTDLYTQLGNCVTASGLVSSLTPYVTTTQLSSTLSSYIPGPYENDAAAATHNVSVGSPYYQTSGQVFVRLT
jgi:hypothetical protein